jgi:hypothetical protein
MHLPQLIEAIHEVHSPLISPYVDHNRQEICRCCAFLHSSICPCPMDYLAVPLVEAVEAVDQRLERRDKGRRFVSSLPVGEADLGDVAQAYEEAVGRWTGCDWPTRFGRSGLDLNGCTSAEAMAMAVDAMGTDEEDDWSGAGTWLARVEHFAELAEAQAALALTAANAGEWPEAVAHARRARALEFATGRPIRREGPLTWSPFCRAVEAAANAHRQGAAAK